MKNLNTKTLLAASVATLISVNTFAVDLDSVTVTFDHPQSIAISNATNTLNATSGTVTTTTWEVTSNNAVELGFSGTSKNETGGTVAQPIFAKQEVDARGAELTTYDHLVTTYGIQITNAGSIETGDDKTTWGTASTATGTPSDLVAAKSTTTSATAMFKAIMPNDTGKFNVILSSKGVGDTSATQSGNYEAIVTTTLTAAEKLNPTSD
jgi:hypothetical protein